MAEGVAWRYSQRKDYLTEEQQKSTERKHDEEMARLHLETARVQERAAELEKEAASVQLQLQQLRFPRTLNVEKFEAAIQKISPFSSYEVLYDANAPDASFLATIIWGTLLNAKWPTQQTAGPAPLRAPPAVLPWANLPWTVAAGGGSWGLSVVTTDPPDLERNSRGAALVRAFQESVNGPPAHVTLGYQTSEPIPLGGVRIIVGPKLP